MEGFASIKPLSERIIANRLGLVVSGFQVTERSFGVSF